MGQVTAMVTGIMELADSVCRNGQLSATEIRESLRETKYEALAPSRSLPR